MHRPSVSPEYSPSQANRLSLAALPRFQAVFPLALSTLYHAALLEVSTGHEAARSYCLASDPFAQPLLEKNIHKYSTLYDGEIAYFEEFEIKFNRENTKSLQNRT